MRPDRGAVCEDLSAHVALELAHLVIRKTTLLLVLGSIGLLGAVAAMRTNLVRVQALETTVLTGFVWRQNTVHDVRFLL
jgi:hypothetical protein